MATMNTSLDLLDELYDDEPTLTWDPCTRPHRVESYRRVNRVLEMFRRFRRKPTGEISHQVVVRPIQASVR